MGPEVVNKNRNCVFNGPYAGRDLYITMLEDTDREFVVTHNANIKPVSYFTGRETELQELRQRIEDGRKSVLVSGMGGIGKTHICRKLFEEYLNKHAEGKDGTFKHIGYIDYNGDMGSSLQNCLKFKQQDSPEQNLEAAWRELEYLASDGKLLLFVDNVNKSINVDPGLQRLKGIPGAVILTSRQASFGDEFELYRIEFLHLEQCKEIYEKIRFKGSGRKVRPEEEQDLKYVIEDLARRHTITVELLAHLAWTKTWPVKKLREKLEEKGFCLEFHRDGKIVNIQKAYEALYDLSELTEAEQNVLEAFSVFPYIPLAIETCNEWLLTDAGVSEDDDILMGLYQKGWLQFDMEQESYSMHPVFAQIIFTKSHPKAEDHMNLLNSCQESVEIPKSGLYSECKIFIPFAKNLIEKISVEIEFYDKLAHLLVRIGEYGTAKELYKAVLDFELKNVGENHLSTASCYTNLATAYDSQGEFDEAISLYKKALRIQEKESGSGNLETARCYNNLGYAYTGIGEYNKAKNMYEKALRIQKRVNGEIHPDTAACYNNIATIYAMIGKYNKAESLFNRSLKILKKLGDKHPELVYSYVNLAYVYVHWGKYEEAESLYKKGLGIQESALGKDCLDTAQIYNNLAELYFMQDKYLQAEELYIEYIRILKKVLEKDNFYMFVGYNNLGMVYVMQKEDKKALKCLLKAYKIAISELGLKHFQTNNTYVNMQIAYYENEPNGNFEHWLDEKMKE